LTVKSVQKVLAGGLVVAAFVLTALAVSRAPADGGQGGGQTGKVFTIQSPVWQTTPSVNDPFNVQFAFATPNSTIDIGICEAGTSNLIWTGSVTSDYQGWGSIGVRLWWTQNVMIDIYAQDMSTNVITSSSGVLWKFGP
jgi:hypothetical protein